MSRTAIEIATVEPLIGIVPARYPQKEACEEYDVLHHGDPGEPIQIAFLEEIPGVGWKAMSWCDGHEFEECGPGLTTMAAKAAAWFLGEKESDIVFHPPPCVKCGKDTYVVAYVDAAGLETGEKAHDCVCGHQEDIPNQ